MTTNINEPSMEPPLKKMKTQDPQHVSQTKTTSSPTNVNEGIKTVIEDESKFGISEYFGAHQFAVSGILKER
jgi:hypothetical protein